MATYYVDGQTGSNAAAGTDVAPWLTLTYAAANSTNSDVIKARGVFREADVVISGSTGRVITNWGSSRAKLRNTMLITGWSLGTGVYVKTIATGLSAKCLIVDWDTSVAASGQHFGHVQAVALAATVAVTNDSWNYNSVTGLLTVRIGANIDPATFTVEIGLGGAFALIQAENCTGLDLSGFDIGPNCDGTAGKGYGFLVSGTGNNTHDCDGTDLGYHCFGLVANGAYALSGNAVVNCRSFGSWGDNGGGSLSRGVTYIENGVASNNFWSLHIAYKTNPLLRDGVTYMTAPVAGGTAFVSSGGNFWHGGSGTGTHASLTHWRCQAISNTGTVAGGIDFCGSDSANAPSDYKNPNTYCAKNIECTVTGSNNNAAPNSTGTSQAFVRCRLDYGGISTVSATQVNCGYTQNTAGTETWGHFNCQIKANLNNASGKTLYGVTAANRLAFIQCSFLEYGSNSNNNFRNFFNWSSTPTVGIYTRNCVFAYATTNATKSLQTNDSTMAAGLHDFLGNCYRSITANFYSANTAFDSQAEWTSLVDTQATIASVDPYTDMTGAGDLILVPTIAAVVRPWQPNATIGVNNVTMGKMFGSWGTLSATTGSGRSSGGRGGRIGRVARVA